MKQYIHKCTRMYIHVGTYSVIITANQGCAKEFRMRGGGLKFYLLFILCTVLSQMYNPEP